MQCNIITVTLWCMYMIHIKRENTLTWTHNTIHTHIRACTHIAYQLGKIMLWRVYKYMYTCIITLHCMQISSLDYLVTRSKSLPNNTSLCINYMYIVLQWFTWTEAKITLQCRKRRQSSTSKHFLRDNMNKQLRWDNEKWTDGATIVSSSQHVFT